MQLMKKQQSYPNSVRGRKPAKLGVYIFGYAVFNSSYVALARLAIDRLSVRLCYIVLLRHDYSS